MRENHESEIRMLLAQYKALSEFILMDITSEHYGRDINLLLEQSCGGQDTRAISLRFSLVQEFLMWNDINAAQCEHPELMDWGFGELALVVLENDPARLARYKHLGVGLFHHIAIYWEGNRRIDIIFSRLEVIEGPGS